MPHFNYKNKNALDFIIISIKFIFVFLPKSGVSHILCVTFIYFIQYKLILLQTLNCHTFICIMIASGSSHNGSQILASAIQTGTFRFRTKQLLESSS